GNGTCGKCAVRVTSGECAPSPACREFFSEPKLRHGWRLACQARITTACTVEIPDSARLDSKAQILTTSAGRHLHLHPEISKKLAAGATGDATVTNVWRGRELLASEPGDTRQALYGVACDLGTTTIAAALMDLTSGREVAVAAAMNPQVALGDDVISRGVNGIVLAPLDDRALVRPVQDAMRDKIPVVIIDSGLQGKDYVSFIATDNYHGGVLAARRLGSLLGGKGRVLVIRYQAGSASTTERERGFLETLERELPGLTLLAKDQYAGPTTETAYQTAENLLGRFPDATGLFCPNESSTFGALRAVQESGLAGKIRFVGFDSSPKLVLALAAGHLDGLVLQNPVKMGYLGVRTMVQYLRGETIAQLIDTGVTLATKDNMGTDEIKSLLTPDLSILER
ncbi:MAG: substrate-binding domain-containing protein, partial [candidate division NC10 bacterium]